MSCWKRMTAPPAPGVRHPGRKRRQLTRVQRRCVEAWVLLLPELRPFYVRVRFVQDFDSVHAGVIANWNHRQYQLPLFIRCDAMERSLQRPVLAPRFLIYVEAANESDAVAKNVEQAAPRSPLGRFIGSKPSLGEMQVDAITSGGDGN